MKKEKRNNNKVSFLPPPPPHYHCFSGLTFRGRILRSEYASGMETGGTKVRKQNTRAGPASQPRGAARTPGPASAEGTD